MRKNRGVLLSFVLIVALLVAGCGLNKGSNVNESTQGKQNQSVVETIKDSELGTEAENDTEEGSENAEVTETTESAEEELSDSSSTENDAENSQNAQNNQNSNTGDNTSTQNPSSSDKTQSSDDEERYIVDQYSIAEEKDAEDFKYGIVRYQIIDRTYYEYNDGTTELINEYSYYDYDCSGYNATDAQLQAESEANAANYISYYNEVLRLTNEIRAEAGVGPLTLDTTLCKAACMRSLEMDYSQTFSHTRPNGSSCFTAMDYFGCGYTTCGENIAAGYSSPASVVEGWKNSPGHYANMIDPDFTKLGVGYTPTNVDGDYWHYWTQLFSN